MIGGIQGRRRANFLFFAAIQFVVLTTIAMRIYPGGTIADPTRSGYAFLGNFFSDLGATRAWSGRSNATCSALFGIALGTLGIAFIVFAGAWRAFAFRRGRARAAGIAAQVFGTLSGAAFLGVAVTPVNLHLDLHNTLVVAAFGLLLGYACCLTILWWRNDATVAQLVASVAYLVLVAVYVAVVMAAVRMGIATERGRSILIVSQKAIAYVSMVYIVYVTMVVRGRLAGPSPD
jgi:hypothetical protein